MRIALRIPRIRKLVAIACAGFAALGVQPSFVERGRFVDVVGEPTGGTPEVYQALLDALVRIDIWCILHYRLGPLYASDVCYCREPFGQEVWQSSAAIYVSLQADCEDLAAHRTAEHILKRRMARVHLTFRKKPEGGRLYHVTVLRRDACVEDPSRRLGM